MADAADQTADTADDGKETLAFQTEVQQLLHLMIHSLYSNKEIFLRELISNASDAADKLRFEALQQAELLAGDADLNVRVLVDKEAGTITVSDNGIGMSRDEVVANIGTIASSGTKQFVASLSGDQAKDAKLIGQFGVGFYSCFIVADRVTLETRRAGAAVTEGVRWESDGSGTFTLAAMSREARGTSVTLHLSEAQKEFLDEWRLRSVISKYSDHIPHPIQMLNTVTVDDEDGAEDADNADKPADEAQQKEKATVTEWQTVNQASALWARPKSEITAEDYTAFYKTVSHDFDEPLMHLHNHVEGKQSYSALLYIPRRAPFDLWDRDHMHGVKLYVRRVFIMDDAKELMPRYLRFVRGVIDSDDLPLNVSREILQKNKVIDTIRAASVKRVLGALETMAENEPERYATFWQAFGQVLKEGPAEDFANKDAIAKLLRFHSTGSDDGAAAVSLADYIGRMPTDQEKIYYITADTLTAARNSPHLEVFRKKGIEVLLMHDRVDEWLMGYLTQFEGKSFQSCAKGEVDLNDATDKAAQEQLAAESKDLVERIKTALGERVEAVRISHRLTDSPACLVVSEQEMAVHMQRLLKEAGHELPGTKPVLEINAEHALVKRLDNESDESAFGDLATVLFDQALLSEGGQLEDPAAFVRRVNQLLAA